MALAVDTPERTKVSFKDLIVSFNEKFDDYVIYNPWNPKEYIVQIGNRLLGFGEKSYLISTLNKIKEDYGEEIPVALIETKIIPEISEPIVRRHGSHLSSKMEIFLKWMIYREPSFKSPVWYVVQSYDGDPSHFNLLKEHCGITYNPSGQFVRGYFGFCPNINQLCVVIVQEKGMSYSEYKHLVEPSFEQYVEAIGFEIPSPMYVSGLFSGTKYRTYPGRYPQVKVVNKPLPKFLELYLDNTAVGKQPREITTGDEFSNRRINNPEWWGPHNF